MIKLNLNSNKTSNKEKITPFSKTLSNSLILNPTTRQKLTKLFTENKELFYPMYNLSLRAQKHMSQERLKRVLQEGLVSVFDFESDPNNIFTTHEMVSYFF